ncbi:hypothetical protein ADUPG1_010806 [Aduncisulcus paluster]|uniref:Uncharacterized protein n=1 Tax=Aduncisulcus paluster TaxID=2918883 RepID=A0ABQ5JSV7_9EUKA|nr:hypothetical protein ADUPG1_010806 [Aduncisulcus paluster]
MLVASRVGTTFVSSVPSHSILSNLHSPPPSSPLSTSKSLSLFYRFLLSLISSSSHRVAFLAYAMCIKLASLSSLSSLMCIKEKIFKRATSDVLKYAQYCFPNSREGKSSGRGKTSSSSSSKVDKLSDHLSHFEPHVPEYIHISSSSSSLSLSAGESIGYDQDDMANPSYSSSFAPIHILVSATVLIQIVLFSSKQPCEGECSCKTKEEIAIEREMNIESNKELEILSTKVFESGKEFKFFGKSMSSDEILLVREWIQRFSLSIERNANNVMYCLCSLLSSTHLFSLSETITSSSSSLLSSSHSSSPFFEKIFPQLSLAIVHSHSHRFRNRDDYYRSIGSELNTMFKFFGKSMSSDEILLVREWIQRFSLSIERNANNVMYCLCSLLSSTHLFSLSETITSSSSSLLSSSHSSSPFFEKIFPQLSLAIVHSHSHRFRNRDDYYRSIGSELNTMVCDLWSNAPSSLDSTPRIPSLRHPSSTGAYLDDISDDGSEDMPDHLELCPEEFLPTYSTLFLYIISAMFSTSVFIPTALDTIKYVMIRPNTLKILKTRGVCENICECVRLYVNNVGSPEADTRKKMDNLQGIGNEKSVMLLSAAFLMGTYNVSSKRSPYLQYSSSSHSSSLFHGSSSSLPSSLSGDEHVSSSESLDDAQSTSESGHVGDINKEQHEQLAVDPTLVFTEMSSTSFFSSAALPLLRSLFQMLSRLVSLYSYSCAHAIDYAVITSLYCSDEATVYDALSFLGDVQHAYEANPSKMGQILYKCGCFVISIKHGDDYTKDQVRAIIESVKESLQERERKIEREHEVRVRKISSKTDTKNGHDGHSTQGQPHHSSSSLKTSYPQRPSIVVSVWSDDNAYGESVFSRLNDEYIASFTSPSFSLDIRYCRDHSDIRESVGLIIGTKNVKGGQFMEVLDRISEDQPDCYVIVVSDDKKVRGGLCVDSFLDKIGVEKDILSTLERFITE